jgi:hypothetical protein
MTDYFVEFKKLKKINANPILTKYEEWDDFSNNIQRGEIVILGQYLELYKCEMSGLSCMITPEHLVLFYDDCEAMLLHIKFHLSLSDSINIIDKSTK